MRALTPWTGLSTLKKEMDRLFHGFWEGDVPHLPSMGDRAHAMDVSETKDAVMVRAEVPGMEPKELQLSLQDQLLTLEGEKNQAKEGWTSLRADGAVPGHGRRLTGHGHVQETGGLFTVTLPKSAIAKGTTIPIKAE